MDGEHSIIAASRRINLPSTRFAIGEESTDMQSINNHSTYKYVKLVKESLSEPLFNQLKNTFLGPIIKAALRPAGGAKEGEGLGFSAQVVHYLVARQIITTRKDELWFYFNNQPMRFSLREFHLVTGLPCYAEDNIQDEENINWPTVEGHHSPADLLVLLRGLEDGESKVRMAMLLLLEIIFLLKYSLKKSFFSSEFLERGKNKMHTYLWGKMAFDLLVESVNELKFIPGKKKDLKGFPMALQLWMLASVPSFETAFARLESDTLALFVCERYTATFLPTYREILSVTDSKEATVISFLADEEDDEDDEVDWKRLVKGGYLLTELDWRRGFIEVDKAETKDKDEDEFDKLLNVQDEDEFDEFNELNVHDEDEGEDVVVKEFMELNVQDEDVYRTRVGRVSKPAIKYSPSGHKTKS